MVRNPPRILFLCTGNLCRSPMAEYFLLDLADRRRLSLDVRSAGTARQGVPSPPEVVTAMSRFGLDLSGHRSRTFTEDDLEGADLIIGMERRHVRTAAVAAPATYRRMFTLKELDRIITSSGGPGPDEELRQWSLRVSEGRRLECHLGASLDDDVPDPMGRSLAVYDRTAEMVGALCTRLADGLENALSPTAGRPG